MDIVIGFGKKEIYFVFFRYLLYAILAIRGFIFAYYLGPFFLGIYGYIMLYQQYFSYSNLGFQYSVNYEFAVTAEIERKKKIVNSALTGTLIVSFFLVIVSVFIFYNKVPLFPINMSYKYIVVLILITILSNFQQIFINVFRAEKLLHPIIIAELIIAISSLLVVPFYSGIDLVNAIFYVWVISLVLTFIYFLKSYPNKISFDVSYIFNLTKIGFPLLIYGFSYFLMSQIARTLIGAFYPIEVMGYFSFANNITTSIMLGLETITWIIFPTMIAKLASEDFSKGDMGNYIASFTNRLLVLVLLIVSFSIVLLPILFKFLPNYEPIHYSLIILLVNQVVFNAGFVFVTLFIARKMHIQMAVLGLLSAAISGTISFIFSFYEFHYIWLVVSNILGSLFFINVLIILSAHRFQLSIKELRGGFSWLTQTLFILITIVSVLEIYWLIILLLITMLLYKFKPLQDLYKQLILIVTK